MNGPYLNIAGLIIIVCLIICAFALGHLAWGW